jgi:hypothetical protein
MSDPALDVVSQIVAQGVSGLTLNKNLFSTIPPRAPGRGVPQKAVFALQSGGRTPTGFLDGNSGINMRYPVVTLTVRSSPHNFSEGQQLARAVYNALHRKSFGNYVSAIIRQSEPLYLQQEENGCFVWSMDCDLLAVE